MCGGVRACQDAHTPGSDERPPRGPPRHHGSPRGKNTGYPPPLPPPWGSMSRRGRRCVAPRRRRACADTPERCCTTAPVVPRHAAARVRRRAHPVGRAGVRGHAPEPTAEAGPINPDKEPRGAPMTFSSAVQRAKKTVSRVVATCVAPVGQRRGGACRLGGETWRACTLPCCMRLL